MTPAAPARRLGLFAWVVVFPLAVLSTLGALIAHNLPALAEWAALRVIEGKRLGPARLQIKAIGIGGATIEGVSLIDGAITADRIELGYDIDRLLSGWIGLARISGLVSTARLDAFDLLGDGNEAGGLTVETIVVDDAEVLIDTPFGQVELHAFGQVRDMGAAGAVTAEIAAAHMDVAGRGAGGRAEVALDWSDDLLTARLRRPAEVLIEDGAAGSLTIVLEQAEIAAALDLSRVEGTFAAALDGQDGLSVALSGTIGRADGGAWALEGRVQGSAAPGSAELALDTLDVRASYTPGAPLVLGGSGGSLTTPWGMVGGLGGDLAADGTVRLFGVVAPAGDPAPVLPLFASLHLDPGRMAAEGTLSGPSGAPTISLSAHLDPDTGRGEGVARMAALDLAPDGLRLETLFPILAGHLPELTGRIAVHGTAEVANGTLGQFRAEVMAEDMTVVSGGIRAEAVNGVVTFDGLDPLTTPPGQKIAAGRITAGLPLERAEITFRLLPGHRLDIAAASALLAGGRVHVPATAIDLDPPRGVVLLDVAEVGLDQLAALSGLFGLSATGRLDGRVPLVFDDDGIRIAEGRLSATRAGVLRYDPIPPPAALAGGGEGVALMLTALRDFRYREVRLGLDGRVGGDIRATLFLAGMNPALQDGYPLEFNLAIEGKLDRIIESALRDYDIPETIRERVRAFEADRPRN